MGGSIFISYRRAETLHITGRIHDYLELAFGSGVIFRDIDSIEFGDFTLQLNVALQQCKVLIAIVGPKWTTIKDGKNKRLDDPEDYVRNEITSALSRDISLIPVIVDGARMPRRRELPESLRDFEKAHACEVRGGRDFQQDMYNLCQTIAKTTGIRMIDFRSLLYDCRKLGISRAFLNFADDNSFLPEIARANDLLVVMNDGRSWISSNRDIVRARVSDTEKRTRVVLIHPKSNFIATLVMKNNKSLSQQVDEIKGSYNIINNGIVAGSQVEIRGHFIYNPFALILTEEFAFVSPYYYNESGALPLFKYHNTGADGMYNRLKADAISLFDSAIPLDEGSFR